MKPEFSQWRDSGSLKIAKIKRLLNFASENQHSMLLLNFSKLRMGHVGPTVSNVHVIETLYEPIT